MHQRGDIDLETDLGTELKECELWVVVQQSSGHCQAICLDVLATIDTHFGWDNAMPSMAAHCLENLLHQNCKYMNPLAAQIAMGTCFARALRVHC